MDITRRTGFAQRSTHFQLSGQSSEHYDHTLGARVVNNHPSNHDRGAVNASSSSTQTRRNVDHESKPVTAAFQRIFPTAQEIQSRNRESHIFSYNEATADERRASNARIQELSQASSSQAPSLADAAGRPLRQYGESCGPNSPFGKYHNSVGLATQFAIAQSSLSSTEAMMDNGPGTHQHVPSAVVPLDKAMKQAFLQGEAVVTTLHSQASHAGAPPHASETIRTAVSLVSASPPSAVPGSYPVTAAALRELHGSPAPPVEGGPRSPPRYSPAAGPAHEFVPASTSRAARQALYTSDNTAQGMMAGSASSAQMTLMESSWGGEGAIRSARYAPAGVPAGGRWDRPGEVTHPAHAHAARQRLLQGSIPPGHLG